MALHLTARLHNKLTMAIEGIVLPASLVIRAVAEHQLASPLLVVQVPASFVGVSVSVHILTIPMSEYLSCVRWLHLLLSLLCIPYLDSIRHYRHLNLLYFLALFRLCLGTSSLALGPSTSVLIRL